MNQINRLSKEGTGVWIPTSGRKVDRVARWLSDQSSFSTQVKFGKECLDFVYGVLFIVCSTFFADDDGFLINKETERGRSGYSQGAEPQRVFIVPHVEVAHSAQGRKFPAVIQGSSKILCPGSCRPSTAVRRSMKSCPSQAGTKGQVS